MKSTALTRRRKQNSLSRRLKTLKQQIQKIEQSLQHPARLTVILPEILVKWQDLLQQMQADLIRTKAVLAEREQLLASEQEQRLLAETLGEVFLTLTSQTTREAVLDEILRQLRRIVPHSAANIVLLERGLLRVVRWQGYASFGSEKLLANLEQPLADFPLDAEVVQSQQPLIVADTSQNSRWVTVPDSAWVKSFVAVPLILTGRILGLLRLDSHMIDTFSQREVDRLRPLANAAAIALENTRLYEESRREVAERKQTEEMLIQRNAQLMALQYAGAALAASLDLEYILDTVTHEMVNLLKVERCVIFQLDHVRNVLTCKVEHFHSDYWDDNRPVEIGPVKSSILVERVIQERRAHWWIASQANLSSDELNYMQAGRIKTLLLLPMEFQDEVIGLVELADWQAERVFSDEELRLIQLLANQAASVIQNARLYHQMQLELSERVQAEKELRQMAVKNQAMLDAIPDSMFYFSRAGQLLDYKVAANEDLPPGVVGETKIGRNVYEILPPELADQALAYINQAQVSPLTIPVFEYQLDFLPKPQYFEARFVASGPDEVLMIVRNITRRKQTTHELKKSEANLRAIFDSAVQAFLLINTAGIIQTFNSRAARGANAILGKEIREGISIYEFVNHEYLEGFEQNFAKTLAGESVSLERQIKVGERVSWYEVNYNPVFAEQGQVIGVCLSTINIDERKKAVEALAASEARLVAEMEAVLIIAQALVSEIDLNNLLEFIITQAEYLTNANGAAVLLLSEDGQYLEVATPGRSWLNIKPGARLLIQGSLAEQVLITSQVQTCNDVLDNNRVTSILALLESSRVNALLCAPLVIHHNNLGVLLIWTEKDQVFDAYDIRLMNLFASQAALALHNAHLHARNRQVAVEQERQRLARDLHDSVTQSLYSIGLAADACSRMLQQGTYSRLQEPFQHIHTLSQSALMEMREQLYQLHPTILNEDLVEALSRQCRMLSQQYSLAIDFKAAVKTPLSHSQGDALYYIAREALWNVIKHAKASRIEVTLARENDHLLLSVIDNGIGFDSSSIKEGETMGLRTMQERTKELDGVLNLQSAPGHGTHLTVRIPFKSKVETHLSQISN